jgi:hypothetical protein
VLGWFVEQQGLFCVIKHGPHHYVISSIKNNQRRVNGVEISEIQKNSAVINTNGETMKLTDFGTPEATDDRLYWYDEDAQKYAPVCKFDFNTLLQIGPDGLTPLPQT